jgi:hypothetical protein
MSILWSVFAKNTGVGLGSFVFLLVESWWSLGTLNPVSFNNISVTSESAFRIWENINEIF